MLIYMARNSGEGFQRWPTFGGWVWADVRPRIFWLRGEPTGEAVKFFLAAPVCERGQCFSILVRQHDGDGGLRVVNVECAASGD